MQQSTKPVLISVRSGVDHEKVSNPQWNVYDWCWYWELDARKGYKKAGEPDPGRMMDCGEMCKCRKKNVGKG